MVAPISCQVSGVADTTDNAGEAGTRRPTEVRPSSRTAITHDLLPRPYLHRYLKDSLPHPTRGSSPDKSKTAPLMAGPLQVKDEVY